MRLWEARAAHAAALNKLESAARAGDVKAIPALDDEVERLAAKIDELQRAQSAGAGGALRGGTGDPTNPGAFKDLGEQLLAIVRHYGGGETDPRLIRAPSGMGETDPSGGGFLLQTDFAETVMTRMYDTGEVAQRVGRLSLSSKANSIKIPGIDETSRATGSRWGGVRAYWMGEGDQIAASAPKFRWIELDLKKLAALWYVTDELLEDASVLTGIANTAFTQEMGFVLEDAIYRGSGAGQPLGFLNTKALITVPAEKGQATKTLLYQNLLNMWSRMWGRSRLNAVWFINQDVEPQLYQVNEVIGTAGVPVYLPPGGISEKPYSTLFGRPVIPVEYADTLGMPGDVVLVDLSQYLVADKASMQQATSVHVRFIYDEMTFRLVYRVDGESAWHAPLTPYKGTNTRSPFVALAQR
jgi:HK97 family phage major capsid protein